MAPKVNIVSESIIEKHLNDSSLSIKKIINLLVERKDQEEGSSRSKISLYESYLLGSLKVIDLSITFLMTELKNLK